ncbi:MAG: NAD(P)H-hydrate epimerase, partial [Solimonas sp.]
MEDKGHSLYSAEQVRELDRRAIADHGIPGYTLMQRAARACWKALSERWPQARSVCVVCGAGNNGGDGYEIARLARAAGWRVHVLVAGSVPTGGDARRASAAWQADGGVTLPFDGPLPAADIVVDALFGTGLKRQLDAGAIAVVHAINAARAAGARTVAVDLPSGLDASTGTAAYGAAVQADLTVSFIGRKFGLYTAQGPQLAGECVFDALELPAVVYAQMPPLAHLQMAGQLCALLPRRARIAHKGDHGHVLLVGGNHGMAGAV